LKKRDFLPCRWIISFFAQSYPQLLKIVFHKTFHRNILSGNHYISFNCVTLFNTYYKFIRTKRRKKAGSQPAEEVCMGFLQRYAYTS